MEVWPVTKELYSFENLMPSWVPRLLEIFGDFLVERHEGFEVLPGQPTDVGFWVFLVPMIHTYHI